ncbi:ABC transporter permease [Salipaludibacillus sp. CF4.18]|uniref:ABC transporter permease n=1 Tax=Salipaludibacillus sp. CF4.18 TaxID=3373081 RepID=UPI003EE6459C
MVMEALSNTGQLSRFIFRLDRVRISLWLIGLLFFTLLVPTAFIDLYGSQQERDAMAETMANPAMTAMVGPGDLANYTVGAMTAHQMLLMTAAVVGLMSIILVTRHTRADEEDGRIEMIRSLPTGRLAYLNANIIISLGTNLVLALLSGIGLFVIGIESMNLQGSLLYGATLGGTGLFFAGVTAVFAQLSETSRGTLGLSVAVLIVSYLIRAVGDVSNAALSWLSPLGWVTKTEVYTANNWGPVLILVSVSIILLLFALYLNAIRDLESGFLPSKPGRRFASHFLQSPLGLAFRLQRTGVIAWAIGMYVLGVSYGSVLGDLETFFESNELMEQMLTPAAGVSLTEQFIPMLMLVITLLATVPPIMTMNKLRLEEKKERIDHLLSRAVSRAELLGGYVVLSIINGFVMLSPGAIGLWSAGAAVMEDGLGFGMIYAAALAYYPAMLVMISITVFLIGYLPKLTNLIWAYVFYSFIVLYLGGLFQFPEWVGNLSPFGHVPQSPIEKLTFMPLFLLSALAVVLLLIGFNGFNKRDIEN